MHNSFNGTNTVLRPGESREGEGRKKNPAAPSLANLFSSLSLMWHLEGSRTRKGLEPGSHMKPNPFCPTSRPIDPTLGHEPKEKFCWAPAPFWVVAVSGLLSDETQIWLGDLRVVCCGAVCSVLLCGLLLMYTTTCHVCSAIASGAFCVVWSGGNHACSQSPGHIHHVANLLPSNSRRD